MTAIEELKARLCEAVADSVEHLSLPVELLVRVVGEYARDTRNRPIVLDSWEPTWPEPTWCRVVMAV